MYPDGTNRHYTIKKMFNRSNAENAENGMLLLSTVTPVIASVLSFMRCCLLSSLLFLRIKCDEKEKRCGK
nr:unnamed protein product [Callosobruchus analis]